MIITCSGRTAFFEKLGHEVYAGKLLRDNRLQLITRRDNHTGSSLYCNKGGALRPAAILPKSARKHDPAPVSHSEGMCTTHGWRLPLLDSGGHQFGGAARSNAHSGMTPVHIIDSRSCAIE